MATLEQRNQARGFLQKAQEYLESAQDNLDLERLTPAAGDAIHAGLGQRTDSAAATRAVRELIAAKTEVEYGANLISSAKASVLIRRAGTLVELAVQIVRLDR